jgi:predicted  nucleic acid-binding Zn-ribbon protein
VSIVRETRMCSDCGRSFKVDSRSNVSTCFLCGMKAARAEEEAHAAKVDAMPVPAWAEGDPFVGVDGGDLGDYSNHGKWSKGVRA